MVVLIDCLSSVSGGAASYLRNLGPLLSDRFEESPEGHCLKLLAHEEQRPLVQTIPDSRCIWMHGKRLGGYRRVLWERMNLPRITREQRVDVLFTPYQIAPTVYGVKQVLMLCNMEPFRFRDFRYSPGTWLRNYVLHFHSLRSLRAADRVIAVSEFTKDQLVNSIGVGPYRVRTIHHGRDTEFSPEGDIKKDQKMLARIGLQGNYLLTCGSLLPYRRCEDVIAAFERCADLLDTETKLVIAGSGTDNRYVKLVRKAIENSPCRDRILAVGHVPRETMMALYRRCLLFVTATEIEACPNIAIEAMSSGCAIISSDRPPLPEMFKGCSLEFRARDIENMVLQLRTCLEDEALRCDLKARSAERAEAFSWEKCAEETYSALVEWQDMKA